eukprot:TRINITY_DN1953_c0_g1_i4.p1 TRINITY_DN1953_c0_g1~~TRINITY_DN1953_c0_g1_i4.p1  ORF type:complete len:425 (+),score=61.79 TRINITY_DN1953_c0_g1_i4:157-1431(+)
MTTEKERHEAFVRTADGTSFSEVAAILALLPVVVCCERVAVHYLHQLFKWRTNSSQQVLISFFVGISVVIAPMMFLITKPESVTWILMAVLFILMTLWITGRLPQTVIEYSVSDSMGVSKALSKPEKPFITAYRSSLLIVTCIAILAVDFPLFPRRFAKTESFGTSLMDVGVGAFMISGALVSTTRDGDRGGGARVGSKKGQVKARSTMVERIIKTLKSVAPLLFLGFARLFFIKSVDYQENVSEYGVHWNFFFTLGFLRLLHAIFVIPSQYSAVAAVIIASLYECALLLGGGADFIVSNQPRTNLISMNKEGLFSVVGYFAIFLFGLQLGRYVLGKHQQRSKKDWMTVLLRIVILDVMFWIATFLVHHYVQPTSRRMVFPFPFDHKQLELNNNKPKGEYGIRVEHGELQPDVHRWISGSGHLR